MSSRRASLNRRGSTSIVRPRSTLPITHYITQSSNTWSGVISSSAKSWFVEPHQLIVPYVESDKNLADFFTKPIPARKFFPLRKAIMNEPNES